LFQPLEKTGADSLFFFQRLEAFPQFFAAPLLFMLKSTFGCASGPDSGKKKRPAEAGLLDCSSGAFS